jgi:nucleoside-diphosphate-sugar epimerase
VRIFLAGATGVIGQRLALLLRHAEHEVAGTTRNAAKQPMLRELGIVPVVVDVFEPDQLARAIESAKPDVVIHQLTELTSAPGTPGYPAAQQANRRLRIEGTQNLVRAAKMAGAHRIVAQSIAFAYAPAEGTIDENHPLDLGAEGVRRLTVEGIVGLEREVLNTAGIAGVALRYGYFYGPGTWYQAPPKPPSVHVDAAANAALLAVTRGLGVYNISNGDGVVSIAKATRDLAFEPGFRIPEATAQKLAALQSRAPT